MMMLRCFAIFASLPLVVFGKFLYPCSDSEASRLRNDIKWGFGKYFKLEGILHDLGVRYSCLAEDITSHKGPYFLTFHITKDYQGLSEYEVTELISKAVEKESKNSQSALKKELDPLVDELMAKEEERADGEPRQLVLNVGCFLAEDGVYYPEEYSVFCSFSLTPPPPGES